MRSGSYSIRIEALENGYKVEVPDHEAIAKKEKERAKSGDKYPVYVGDCTKSYAAKSVAEVKKLVGAALEGLPAGEYESGFSEAAKDD